MIQNICRFCLNLDDLLRLSIVINVNAVNILLELLLCLFLNIERNIIHLLSRILSPVYHLYRKIEHRLVGPWMTHNFMRHTFALIFRKSLNVQVTNSYFIFFMFQWRLLRKLISRKVKNLFLNVFFQKLIIKKSLLTPLVISGIDSCLFGLLLPDFSLLVIPNSLLFFNFLFLPKLQLPFNLL
jgi:hypothetical protein